MKYLIKPVIRHPYLTAVLILGITIFLGYNLKNLQLNNKMSFMLPDDHPAKIAQDEMEEEFGAPEVIIIGLVTDNIFKTDFLSKIKELSKKLKRLRIAADPVLDPKTGKEKIINKKCIKDVDSLSSIYFIDGNEYGMEVGDLMEKVPKTSEEMGLFKKKVFSWDFYVGSLVSADSKATTIAIKYKSGLTLKEQFKMAGAVQRTVEQAGFSEDVDVYIAGEPFVNAIIVKNQIRDLSLMLPIVFVIIIVFLLLAIRSFSSVILIFVTIAVCVIWTMGLMGLFGFTLELITSAIPILLVAIASADCIHMVCHYLDERAEGKNAAAAIQNTINVIGTAILATSVTTMAGFMSLMSSSLPSIKAFGLFTGIGIGVAFIASVVFVPALLIILDRFSKARSKEINSRKGTFGINFVPFLKYSSEKATAHRNVVFALSTLFAGVAIVFSFQIHVDLNPIKVFKKNATTRKADAFLCEKFTGTTTTAITLEADVDDYFKQPEILRKLDDFKRYMKKDAAVGTVISLADPIKRMNYVMNGNKNKFNSIPETRAHVAQYLLLNSDPEALEGMVTADYRKARIVVLLKDGSAVTLKRVNRKMTDWLDKEISGLNISMAGLSQTSLAMNELIVNGQMKSLAWSVVLVLIIASIVLRSFIGGILAVMPLSISVLLNFCILGMFDIPLDLATALIASISIGIGVDYSIHLLNGVKHGSKAKGEEHAVFEGLKISGNAIIFNALAVALGFLVLTSSSFTPLIKLGSFIALTMVSASAVTMILLPLLINTIRPRFLRG